MTGKAIAILDTSYLSHLAQASGKLGSTLPIERFLSLYDVRIPDQVYREFRDSTLGLDPATRGEMIATSSR